MAIKLTKKQAEEIAGLLDTLNSHLSDYDIMEYEDWNKIKDNLTEDEADEHYYTALYWKSNEYQKLLMGEK